MCVFTIILSIVLLLVTYVSFLFQLGDQGSAYHECNIVFFMPGLYKIDIQCSSHGKAVNFGGPPGETSSGSCPAHTWKLIPPIEITVTDP